MGNGLDKGNLFGPFRRALLKDFTPISELHPENVMPIAYRLSLDFNSAMGAGHKKGDLKGRPNYFLLLKRLLPPAALIGNRQLLAPFLTAGS